MWSGVTQTGLTKSLNSTNFILNKLAKYGLNCRLLFTDTDSFCYSITTDDLYMTTLSAGL